VVGALSHDARPGSAAPPPTLDDTDITHLQFVEPTMILHHIRFSRIRATVIAAGALVFLTSAGAFAHDGHTHGHSDHEGHAAKEDHAGGHDGHGGGHDGHAAMDHRMPAHLGMDEANNEVPMRPDGFHYKRGRHASAAPAVTFRDRQGRKVDFADLLATDRPVLLNFIFTSCATICPVQSATFGQVQPDLAGIDAAKVCVVNRYSSTKQYALGLVSGTGMKRGAIALSVGHDAHNISVTGKSDEDMAVAFNDVVKHKGGMTVALDGNVVASLPLPVAGLMSDLPLYEVIEKEGLLQQASKEKLGCTLKNPFMALSFIQLEVIPKLKITNKGLINTETFEFVPPIFTR